MNCRPNSHFLTWMLRPSSSSADWPSSSARSEVGRSSLTYDYMSTMYRDILGYDGPGAVFHLHSLPALPWRTWSTKLQERFPGTQPANPHGMVHESINDPITPCMGCSIVSHGSKSFSFDVWPYEAGWHQRSLPSYSSSIEGDKDPLPSPRSPLAVQSVEVCQFT